MSIDWAALGQVFGVTLFVTVGIVGLFTLGIVGTSRKPQPEGAPAPTGGGAARVGAYACFALCATAVAYGIYLIVAA
ncbi:hypothetical protein [Streptomyces sp. NPDC059788]|uniref:hypothetical protein n=1 Tax=Streptomyces sp. NPDC059788 TaxID=3346948 RepID=UPI003660FB86